MEDGGAEFVRRMSREERRAFQELFNACEAFLELSEQIQEELDSAEEERVYSDEDVALFSIKVNDLILNSRGRMSLPESFDSGCDIFVVIQESHLFDRLVDIASL